MNTARGLRKRNASRDEIRGAAYELYPSQSKGDKSMRSRLQRACNASPAEFEKVEQAYGERANIIQITAVLPRMTASGAPTGNLNAQGKKKDFSLKRINGYWRSMSPEKQDEFLATHQLMRTKK